MTTNPKGGPKGLKALVDLPYGVDKCLGSNPKYLRPPIWKLFCMASFLCILFIAKLRHIFIYCTINVQPLKIILQKSALTIVLLLRDVVLPAHQKKNMLFPYIPNCIAFSPSVQSIFQYLKKKLFDSVLKCAFFKSYIYMWKNSVQSLLQGKPHFDVEFHEKIYAVFLTTRTWAFE